MMTPTDSCSSAGVPSAAKGLHLTQVVANEPLCREHFRLVLRSESFPEALPGQFVQVLCADPADERPASGAFIRRPFSLAGRRQADGATELDIIHRVVGPGTRWMAQLDVGQAVSVLGPLGNPFPIPQERTPAYLVGGGVGLPPIMWLAEMLKTAGHDVSLFCGARTADLLPLKPVPGVAPSGEEPTLAFEPLAGHGIGVVVSTDDGSLGGHGLIPAHLDAYLDRHAPSSASGIVYSCGPEPMMRAVADHATRRNIMCYLCLERMMACGMGTCQSCVVRIRDEQDPQGWRYRLCCSDGPVFDSRDVLWD